MSFKQHVFKFAVLIFSLSSVDLWADFCSEGSLYVELAPANSVDGAGAGFSIQTANKKIIAQRLFNHPRTFTIIASRCKAWAKNSLPHLYKSLLRHKKNRKDVQCVNIAYVKYSDSKTKDDQKICLGSSKKDLVTREFKAFYEKTEIFLLK